MRVSSSTPVSSTKVSAVFEGLVVAQKSIARRRSRGSSIVDVVMWFCRSRLKAKQGGFWSGVTKAAERNRDQNGMRRDYVQNEETGTQRKHPRAPAGRTFHPAVGSCSSNARR